MSAAGDSGSADDDVNPTSYANTRFANKVFIIKDPTTC